MELYDPEACFISSSGEVMAGRERIRPVLARLIDTKTRFQSRIVKAVTVGDTALLYTNFEGTMVDATGGTVEVRSKAIEVLRREYDGTWKLIIGEPNGRT